MHTQAQHFRFASVVNARWFQITKDIVVKKCINEDCDSDLLGNNSTDKVN